jgi:GNAT superfamily N-acetyltransferase
MVGLKKMPQYNGVSGVVETFLSVRERFSVRITASVTELTARQITARRVTLRSENVRHAKPGKAAATQSLQKCRSKIVSNSRAKTTSVASSPSDSAMSTSLQCSSVPTKALLGVAQIWVHPEARRRGVARRLLDAARASAVYGVAVPLELCAFSQPTAAGRATAAAYFGREDFLVF